MEAFFELRIYKIFPGKMEEWLNLMEGTITVSYTHLRAH